MSSMFLFVTANIYEKEAFKEHFKAEKSLYVKAKKYEVGKFGLYNVAYIHIDEQGITNPASIPLVGEVIRAINPVGVVMVGIAFGADKKSQKIGDVLVSKQILTYDAERVKKDVSEYKEPPREAGFQLLNAFGDSDGWNYPLKSKNANIYIGAILTGSKLIDNQDFKEKLLKDFSEYSPIGGEMEAYGIYSICKIHGVKEWIIIKSICDWAYNKQERNKEKNQRIASKVAVDYCHYIFTREGIFDNLLTDITQLDNDANHEIEMKYNKAVVLFSNEEYLKATTIFEEVESLYNRTEEPKQYDFFRMLGMSYLHLALEQKNDGCSEAYLNKAISKLNIAKTFISDINNENDIDVFRYLIRAYCELASCRGASQCYNHIIELSNEAISKLAEIDEYKFIKIEFSIDLALAYENLFDITPFEESEFNLLAAKCILSDIYNNTNIMNEESAFRLLHNLGRVYFKLAELSNKEELLDDAIKYYEAALEVPAAHIEDNPTFYAQAYVNIGNAYLKKSSKTESEEEIVKLCNEAAENYSIALDVYSHQSSKYELAMTYSNLATVNLKLYKTTENNGYFILSEEAYKKALAHRNPVSDPIGYGKSQKGIGELYLEQGKQNNDIALLKKADSIFNRVLTIFTKERYIKYYCMIKYYQAIVAKHIALNYNRKENLNKALDILKDILTLCPDDGDSELIYAVSSQIIEIEKDHIAG